jgi:hypothetical protein
MKKLLLVAAVAAGSYLVYRQVMGSKAEDDLWQEVNRAPDFTSDYAAAADSEDDSA